METFQRIIQINLVAVHMGIHFAVPALRRAGGGSIVNISSAAGLPSSSMSVP
ncbi:SDR family NAD(P)-dependent oxidoreductase [Streptomyces albidoflavus]